MRHTVVFVGLLSGLLTVSVATAQEKKPAPGPRQFTLAAGVGNAMGWFGMQGEKYFRQGRISVLAGLGYTPELDSGDANGVAVAAGARAFTGGIKHRGFIELSVSQLAVEQACFEVCSRPYGPGVQLGYQFVTLGGFTFYVSGGVGRVFRPAAGLGGWWGMGGLGFGYTWRRH